MNFFSKMSAVDKPDEKPKTVTETGKPIGMKFSLLIKYRNSCRR